MNDKPIAAGFWSYVQLDDEHETGRISRLRERLERSIQFFSGNRDFRIFQDRKDIGWGEKWKHRIETSLDNSLMLFPVVTPSYFQSNACRLEALAFKGRQIKTERSDLILPIYYLAADQMGKTDDSDAHADETQVAALFRAHQYEDWRALRETPETDPAYGKAVERLAQKAAETLKRSRPATENGALRPKQAEIADPACDTTTDLQPATSASAPPSSVARETPGHIITLTVSPMPGRADFTTISEAVARAPGGARIIVHPGHYRENVVIDKPLEIIGDGSREDILLESEGPEPLIFDTNFGVVRNLTLRQRQSKLKEPNDYCVWIKQGRLELADCDLSSTGGACLAVSDGADPRVRRNRIQDSNEAGILIHGNARGTYEDNEIFNSQGAAIEVDGGSPTVRRNRIYDNKNSGIFIYNKSQGAYEDNEIFGNGLGGIEITEDSNPIVRRNRIYDGSQSGIFLHGGARGVFEDNEISGNFFAGIEVRTGANPVFRRNKIHSNKQDGLYVHSDGRGTYEDNYIFSNLRSGIYSSNGSNISVKRNIIHKNFKFAVSIPAGGSGIFEDNTTFENMNGAWNIAPSAMEKVIRKGNQEQ